MYRLLMIFLLVWLFSPSRLSSQGWDWQNPLPFGYGINAIEVLDRSRAIAVCDNGYILYTWNEGKTWVPFRIAWVNLHDIIRMEDASLLIAADRRRILRSTDDGMSWTLTYQGSSQAAGFRSALARVNDCMAVGFLNGAEVITSTDCGRTWEVNNNLNLISETPRSISVQSPSIWWLVTSRNTLRTTNAGRTWEKMNDAYPIRGLQRFVFVDSLNGFQLREGQLLRTADGGGDWEEMDIFGFGVVLDIATGPALGDNLYCLSSGRYLINKSSDGGATWNISLTESAFANAYARVIAFVDGKLGFIAGDGGRILRTNDGGQSWSIVHGQGYIGSISDLYFATPQHGTALTYSSTILLTSNGGRRWDEAIPSPDHTLRHFAVSPTGTYFAVGFTSSYSYALFRSDDMGRNWDEIGPIPVTYSMTNQLIPQSLVAPSDKDLLLAVSYANLYRSSDGGRSWDSTRVPYQNINPFSSGEDMFFFSPATIIYSQYRHLAVSTDNGDTWELRTAPAGSGSMFNSTRFLTSDIGYSLLSGRIWKTEDGGRTWVRLMDLDTQLYHFFDEHTGVFVWNDSNDDNKAWLYSTADGGDAWQRSSLGGAVQWNGWYFTSRDEGWAYGYGGRIQHTINGGLVSARPRATIPSAMELSAVWPNPWQPADGNPLTVAFSLSKDVQDLQLSLFDILGREIAVLASGRYSAATHHVSLDASAVGGGIVPGVYVLRMTASGKTSTTKLMLH